MSPQIFKCWRCKATLTASPLAKDRVTYWVHDTRRDPDPTKRCHALNKAPKSEGDRPIIWGNLGS